MAVRIVVVEKKIISGSFQILIRSKLQTKTVKKVMLHYVS
jgi:hypothetical protein